MKTTKSTLLLLCLLLAGTAFAQKAYLTGFSGLSVYDATDIHTQDTVCCGRMVYVTNSYDSSTIYVTHWNDNALYHIDSNDNIVDSMKGFQVWDIVSDDESDKLFGSQTVNNQVYIIDPVAKTYDSVAVTAPDMLEKRPGKKEVWVVHRSEFTVIDYTGAPTATPHTFTSTNTLGRDEVRFTKDGNTALLVHSLIEKVYKIDANTKAVTDSITVPNVFGVEFSSDDSKFYVSAGLKNKIYIYNTASMTLLDSIITTRNPFTMYTNPYTGDLWVVDHNDDSLTIIDPSTNTIVDSTHTTTGAYYLVFNKTGPTSINKLQSHTLNVALYPNPASHTINLSIKADEVTIYDISGRTINNYKNCNSIDVSHLQTGLYLFKVTQKDKQSIQKVTIE